MILLRPRMVTLWWMCLFPASVLSLAQTNSTPPKSDDLETLTASNLAVSSLERAVERAIGAGFSPLRPAADSRPIYLSELSFPAQSQDQNKPASPTAPTLGDLGFPMEQTKGSAAEQARRDKRSHMLKIHQRLGLITTIPLATILSSGLAGGRETRVFIGA